MLPKHVPNDILEVIGDICPDAQCDVDNDGQVIIYTGCELDDDGNLKPFVGED